MKTWNRKALPSAAMAMALILAASAPRAAAQNVDQLDESEQFLAGTALDMCNVQAITYKDDGSLYDIYIGLKSELLFGPRICGFRDRSALYLIGNPYLYATSGTADTYVTEIGFDAGLLYLGKPLLLGCVVPLYWFGNEGQDWYSGSIADMFSVRFLVGLTSNYRTRNIFGQERIRRIFQGLSITRRSYGPYANYTSVGIFLGVGL